MANEEDISPEVDETSEFDGLMGMTLEDILREGQKALFARLVGRCRLGTASHQEMAILRNILRDNGLTLGIPPEQPEVRREPVELPEYDTPEYLQ